MSRIRTNSGVPSTLASALEFEKGFGLWSVNQAGTGAIGFTGDGGALRATVPTDSADEASLIRTIPASSTVTIEGWWRCTTAGLVSGSNVPAFRMYSGAQRLADIYRLNSTGALWLRTVKAAGGSSYTFTTTGESADVGEWVYLSMTYTPSTGLAVVKVNDVTVVNTTFADRFAAATITDLSLGSTEPGNSGEWEARDIRLALAS